MAPTTALRVKNTLTNEVEPFEPGEPGHVRMYVCGPSVYDESHLGHARSYVAFDAVKRYFLTKGFRVTHVQNFTDVEENIAIRAREARMEPLAYADVLIGHFFRDMDALRILRADHYPRVSENIDRIAGIVQDLQEKGFAYCVDCGPRPHLKPDAYACDAYFSAGRAADYGKMIGASVDELMVDHPLQAGERRNPLDFALWKSRDDWGATWASPFGQGRPGWHVECTAMATRYLGHDFDIHGGGLDLVFPHHESERVIGEAWTGERYCRYYLHNGFVTVGDVKMSKSLGNFTTVRDLLARHDPEVLRTFLLSQHYRVALNYDKRAIDRAHARVERWRAQLAGLRRRARGASAAGVALAAPVCKGRDAFWAALEDDFQFGRALDAIDDALENAATLDGAHAAAALVALKEMGAAMGVLWSIED